MAETLKGDIIYDREYVKNDGSIEMFIRPVGSKNNLDIEKTWGDTNLRGQGIFPSVRGLLLKSIKVSIDRRVQYECYADAYIMLVVNDHPQIVISVEEALSSVNLHGVYNNKPYYGSVFMKPKDKIEILGHGFDLDGNNPFAVRVSCEVLYVDIEKET